MLTANNPLLARLAENHTQMVIAHNQLTEAHKMLISQLVGQFKNDPNDPNEPTRASKPKPFAPDVKPQPVAPSVITEHKEVIESETTVDVLIKAEDKPAPVIAEKKVKAPKTETKPTKSVEPIAEMPKPEPKTEPVDIESLDLRHVVALSVLFGDKAVKPDNTQVTKAKATFASEKADSITGQIDALYCALNGVAQLQRFPKAKILTICLKTLANWDNISGITDRREFALSLLTELPTPAEVKPIDFTALRSEASACITQLVKGGYRNEALDILASFNAKKMGDVTDDNLVQFIEKAQSVLANDKSEDSDG
ncbi:hypothetical protein ARAF_0430 [Arsenophonus endosymbiont of Aleurodicus floccissimus]|uniref:hypothetical protein n=1 Tax=Arsenophonus endosymbiont of Aleurodicus floccissimus TaxID=2152761 RepID=UPI000E6B1EC4|nr:hypothetical protein [Arsenophonus endosymbiont of Aleurodicus floccissimus]SPP31311.1 hypothetical protein ARAF_0430 [Arsenophonus endosymbiont of Aleurodicus floccissimus]